MSVQVDPYTFTNGTIADADEVNARITRLYNLQNGGIDADNMDLTAAFAWTGIHTFDAAELRVKGAGLGISTLAFATTANNQANTIPYVGATATFSMQNGTTGSGTGLIPVGGYVMWDDENGTLTSGSGDTYHLNTDIYKLCDGTAVSDSDSPLDGVTFKNWAGRSIIGFGSDPVSCVVDHTTDFITAVAHGYVNTDQVSFTAGTMPTNLTAGTVYFVVNKTADTFQVALTSGGAPIDIGSAGAAVYVSKAIGGTGAMSVVGNALNQIDLYHRHATDIAHPHSFTQPVVDISHAGHDYGTLKFQVAHWDTSGASDIFYMYDAAGADSAPFATCHDGEVTADASYAKLDGAGTFYTKGVSGSTGVLGATSKTCTGGSVTSLGSTSVNSDFKLSATQSIAPISIQTRMYRRIK